MSRTRVLIVDDQPLLRAGFKSVLEASGQIDVVGEAATGVEAIEQARRLDPDVVLMDVRMPDMDGIQASGFLLKDAPVEDLLSAVRAVAAGDAQLSPAVTKRLLDQVARRLPAAVDHDETLLEELTARERDVLRLLALGMSNAEIGEALVVAEATVKTHVSSVLSKLGLRDRVQAVIYAYENGLVAPSP